MAQVLVMQMMSMMNGMGFTGGLFSGSASLSTVSLITHLLFGVVVGFLYGPLKSTVPNVAMHNVYIRSRSSILNVR